MSRWRVSLSARYFAELDLDTSKFSAAQKKILYDSQTLAINQENAWKNLGQKSDVMYTAMRKQAENAYLSISSRVKEGSAEQIRAEEAKNAKIKSLNEQQFGAQTSFIGTLKSHWIAFSAAVVGAVALINKAIAYMDEGAKALQTESAFKIMADSSKVNSEKFVESMRMATRETIDDSALMQKAVKLMTLGYDPAQIERFSKVVITASQIAGTTAAVAYDELSDAIANRMPKALVRMGAVTREQMKIVNEAITNGADSVALYELAMANLELKQKMLQGTQNEAAVSMQRLHAQTKELTETIGKGLIVAIDAAFRGFEYLAAGILGLISVYARYREFIYEIMGDETKAAVNREFANEVLKERNDLLTKSAKGILDTNEAEKKATDEEIANAKKKVDTQMAALKVIADSKENQKKLEEESKHWGEYADAVLKNEENLYNTLARLNKEYWDAVDKAVEFNIKQYDVLDETWEKAAKSKLMEVEALRTHLELLKQESQFAVERERRSTAVNITGTMSSGQADLSNAKDQLVLVQSRLEAENQLWDALGKQNATYEDTLKHNTKEAELTSEIATQREKIAGLMIQQTGTPFEGWMAGWNTYAQQIGTVFDQMKSMAGNVASGMESAFSGFFQSMFDKTKSWSDKMKGLFQGFANSFIKALSDMVAKWLVSSATMQGGGGGGINWLGLIGSVVGGISSIGGSIGLWNTGPTQLSGPGAQEGGVFNQPTHTWIGEAGPEAVIPLKGGAIPVQFTGEKKDQSDKTNVTIFQISCWDAISVRDFVRRNPEAFLEMISKNARGAGAMRGTIKGVG